MGYRFEISYFLLNVTCICNVAENAIINMYSHVCLI